MPDHPALLLALHCLIAHHARAPSEPALAALRAVLAALAHARATGP